MRARLSGWAANTLSLAGRITLAKSVLEAIPVYFMQTTSLPKRVCNDIEKLIRNFIWGSSPSAPKISLVNWETLCQPLENGGLGLRRIHEYNKAFLLKIGLALVSKPNAFWVQLLRQKYKVCEILPQSIARSSCSSLWRSLSCIWDEFRTHMAWSVGNGEAVAVWDDVWLPQIGPLRHMVFDPMTPFLYPSFDDLMLDNGVWNFSLLSSLLPAHIVQHIASTRCPMPSDIMDSCVWRWNPSFSISNAYDILMQPTRNPISPQWNLIWQLAVPQRVRLFLWLACNTKILTNQERHRRTLAVSPVCSICSASNESVLHTLRDCASARAVWKQINPAGVLHDFYRYDLNSWFLHNLQQSANFPLLDLPWCIIFAAFVWHIWKARNDVVFNGARPSVLSTSRRSMTWAAYYASCMALVTPRPLSTISIKWSPPPAQFIALNTDGASCLISGSASIGGLFRNNLGSWLLGFNRNIGVADALQAELWAIFEGLQLAWNLGFEYIQVQSDSLRAISAINATDASSSVIPLVRAISTLQDRSWVVEFLWIKREANQVADTLAKHADNSSFSLLQLESPPSYVQSLLQRDVVGPPYCKTSAL